MYIYIYICIYTRFQKGYNLKKNEIYIPLFNFSPKVSLFDKKTKGMYIFYVYFQIATFLKAGVYIYIHMYLCMFIFPGVLTSIFTKYLHNLIAASYRSHKQCVKDQNNTNERTL